MGKKARYRARQPDVSEDPNRARQQPDVSEDPNRARQQPDVSEDPNRAKIARGLAADYDKAGKSGAGAFAEICHHYTDLCKAEISYIQKSMEMIDNTYFEFLNIGHKEFMKKYHNKS